MNSSFIFYKPVTVSLEDVKTSMDFLEAANRVFENEYNVHISKRLGKALRGFFDDVVKRDGKKNKVIEIAEPMVRKIVESHSKTVRKPN